MIRASTVLPARRVGRPVLAAVILALAASSAGTATNAADAGAPAIAAATPVAVAPTPAGAVPPVAAPAPRFAAPEAASQVAATPAGGLGEVTFALLLVLAAIFGIAWLVRRMRSLGGAGTQGIEILAQVALGARERAVVVKVGDERLLLGVAPGRVSTLHVLPRDAQLPSSAAPGDAAGGTPGLPTSLSGSFAAQLKKSLGR